MVTAPQLGHQKGQEAGKGLRTRITLSQGHSRGISVQDPMMCVTVNVMCQLWSVWMEVSVKSVD